MSVVFWPLLLLSLGVLLLILEVFIPSGGMIGLGSVLCLLLSLWLAYEISPLALALFLLTDLIVLPVAAGAAFSLWSRSPLARRVFLQPPTAEEVDASHEFQDLEHLLGQVGRALTTLRPSGMVEFEGRRLDGLAEEGFLPAGTVVRAMKIRTGAVLVRGLTESANEVPDPWQDPFKELVPGSVGVSEAASPQSEPPAPHDPSRPHQESPVLSTFDGAVSILEEAP